MDTKTIENTQTLIEPIVESLGFELVDIKVMPDRGRTILRILVDKPGGVNIDDCAKVSRELATHLEVSDPLPFAYNLEVSSPGMNRPIKKLADFDRFAGESVSITTSELIEGRRRFKGKNLGVNPEDQVVVNTDHGDIAIDFDLIEKAKLAPEIKFNKK
jgi:ribosome maturation factor RimP